MRAGRRSPCGTARIVPAISPVAGLTTNALEDRRKAQPSDSPLSSRCRFPPAAQPVFAGQSWASFGPALNRCVGPSKKLPGPKSPIPSALLLRRPGLAGGRPDQSRSIYPSRLFRLKPEETHIEAQAQRTHHCEERRIRDLVEHSVRRVYGRCRLGCGCHSFE
jgi:hypothetical protein